MDSDTPSKRSSEEGTRSVRTKTCGCRLRGADNPHAEIRNVHGTLSHNISTGIKYPERHRRQGHRSSGEEVASGGVVTESCLLEVGLGQLLRNGGEVGEKHLGRNGMSKDSEA